MVSIQQLASELIEAEQSKIPVNTVNRTLSRNNFIRCISYSIAICRDKK